MKTRRKTMDMAPGHLSARVQPSSYNEDERTLQVVWGTGEDVTRRSFFGDAFIERLRMEPEAVNLSRMSSGRAPLLRDHGAHSIDNVLGVVRSAQVENGIGTAMVQFSERSAIADVIADVRAGILTQVSVGYTVEEYRHTERDDGPDIFEAMRWTPHEVSLVPIAADGGAHARHEQGVHTARITETIMSERRTTTEEETPETTADAPAESGEVSTGAESEDEDEDEDEETPEGEVPAAAEGEGERRVQLAVQRALQAERTRAAEIQRAVRSARLPESFAQDLVQRGVSVATARAKVLDRLAEQDDLTDTRSGHVAMVSAPRGEDTFARDCADAILCRFGMVDGATLTPRSRDVMGMRLMDMGRAMVSRAGGSTRGSDIELIKRMISTSDFPSMVARVAERSMLGAYQEVPRTFEGLARQVTVSNFATVERLRMSGAPDLLLVPEGGEIQKGPLSGGGESYKISTYARRVALTRQMIISDDMATLARLPAAFGAKARELENRLFYELMQSNGGLGPVMSDGENFFSAAHGNLMPASPIDLAGMTAAREAMRNMTDDAGNPIYLVPAYLVCGPSQETAAEQFLYPAGVIYTDPAQGVPASYRSLTLVVDAHITDDSWYLVAQQGLADTFEYAYLNASAAGVSTGPGPQVDSQAGFEILGVDTRCVLDFGVGAVDWVGVIKTPGS